MAEPRRPHEDVPYLSPAFPRHAPNERGFLRNAHDSMAFAIFWLDIVKPLLEETGSSRLLEIGAAAGSHTRWLLQFCENIGGRLTVVEPQVGPELRTVVDGSEVVDLIETTSREALRSMAAAVDAVLLEGDLNYATVLEDLRSVEELSERHASPFPVVLFASASWPYARRDMYYAPDRLAFGDIHEYARKGMTPWSEGLEDGLINQPFANAVMEGGTRNGVLTAVEDFIEGSALPLELSWIPSNHGLGIIYRVESPAADFVRANVLPPPALARFLETWELARINTTVRRLERERQHASWPTTLRRIIRRLRG